MKALTEYTWPGNVRELENTLERLVVFARDKTITTQDLVYSNAVLTSVLTREPLRLADMERLHIMKVLQRTEGNKSHAAQLLGIDRKTLRTKMTKYRIQVASIQNS
jgi:DNA-binding NtrC family response regulator